MAAHTRFNRVATFFLRMRFRSEAVEVKVDKVRLG